MKANKRTTNSDSSLFGFTDNQTDNEKTASYNLAKFVLTLIEMDKQRHEWQESQLQPKSDLEE